MSRKTGFECLKEIRSHKENLKEVIVTMLSTNNDSENIQKALQMGGTRYAVKPNSFEKLKSLLEEVLSMSLVGAGEEKKKFLLV